MKIRSIYDLGEPVKGLEFKQPSLAQQQFKEDCEIESILQRHNLGGVMGIYPQSEQQPMYADVSDIPDFQVSQTHVARATEYFEGLPSSVRAHFNNNLSEFLSALGNPDARQSLTDMGILKKKADPAPDQSSVLPDQGTGTIDKGGTTAPVKPSEGVIENTPKT